MNQAKELIQNQQIDFLDFGCSNGGSLLFGMKVLGGEKGLGIDVDEKKVNQTKEQGLNAILYDIKNLPNEKLVDFTVMSHFLEHVPNMHDVKAFIEKACHVSRKFVFIKQPYFDADGLLFENNLKTFYSDWHGHPNRMTSLHFYTILRDLKANGVISEFSIALKGAILNSQDSIIHPISSPMDQHHYDENIHPHKNTSITFNFALFSEIVVMISINEPHNIPPKFKVDKYLYTSLATS